MRKFFYQYKRRLTNYDSVLPYALLGVVGGVASGLIVLAFALAIREMGQLLGVANGGDGFEQLPRWMWFALPAAGAIVLGVIYSFLQPEDKETGIIHVLSRMHSHYSVLPLRNAALQFFAGSFALATGQSGGREGPGIHLGGAINSLIGQWQGLPNTSLRMLIACGTAGGIAAAFNTPLAGVVFAMEVIMAEYTVVSFIPVMLAAVSAAAVSHSLNPGGALFDLPPLELNSLLELPFIVLLGLCCGIAVALFIRICQYTAQISHWPVLLRFGLAGCCTGALAYFVPEVLGVGYDTLDLALHNQLALNALLAIALCKIVATAIGCGLGLPVGLIGPNLLIGACLGGALGWLGAQWQPELASENMVYVVVGMGAAMGAVLNAPLAAILAVVELTGTIGLSMAAMLAIVTATLTNTGVFGQRSAHQTMLGQLRRLVPQDPLSQLLHRSDVTATMDTRIVPVPHILDDHDLEPLLEFRPTWCLVRRTDEDLYLVDGVELLLWLEEESLEDGGVDVTEAGIRRWTTTAIPIQATLQQAVDAMRTNTAESACVYDRSAQSGKRILHGVVTREGIEKFTLDRVLRGDAVEDN